MDAARRSLLIKSLGNALEAAATGSWSSRATLWIGFATPRHDDVGRATPPSSAPQIAAQAAPITVDSCFVRSSG